MTTKEIIMEVMLLFLAFGWGWNTSGNIYWWVLGMVIITSLIIMI